MLNGFWYKLIVGFVLAMCLTLGLGVGSLFAVDKSQSLEGYNNNITDVQEKNDGKVTI